MERMGGLQSARSGVSSPRFVSDAEAKKLIRKARAGDRTAFSRLVRAYRPRVAALAYATVRDYDDAADVCQLVFIKLAQALPTFDDDRRFFTWLHRITINAAIDWLRREQRHSHEPLSAISGSLASSRGNPAEVHRQQVIRREIGRCARRLDPVSRRLFIARAWQGRSPEELRQTYRMPSSTIRWHIARARNQLQRDLRSRLSARWAYDLKPL